MYYVDIIDCFDTEVHYGARADDETADATKSISLSKQSNLSSFELGYIFYLTSKYAVIMYQLLNVT